MKFIIGIICEYNDIIIVNKYLKKYHYDLKIFNKFPTLII